VKQEQAKGLVCAYEVVEGDVISDGKTQARVERVRLHDSLAGHRWFRVDGRDVLVRDFVTFDRIGGSE
jgi:hypothetical protein